MPTATTIGVTTADAAPAVAPHRISNKTGKTTATLAITPTHDGVYLVGPELVPPWTPGAAAAIIALIIRLGGTTPYTGTLVGRKGLVCNELEPCSDASLACSDFSSASGVAIAEDVTYTETGGPADGSQTVNVWVCTDGQGWS